jgi:hypothetical protein
MVAVAEGVIAGEPRPARHYYHQGHFIEVEHQSQHVVDHDVAEMEKLGYHVATASELQEYAKSQRKARAIRE